MQGKLMREEAETLLDYKVLVKREQRVIDRFGGTNDLTLPVFDFTRNSVKYRERGIKRFIDVAGASVGLVGLTLIFPVIALGIKLSSKGSIFFIQERTGLNGKIFRCYKFRTMRCETPDCREGRFGPAGKPDITEKGDDRIFLFGKFLRYTNMDELPQLFNILKGEMSLVGPRPIASNECCYWREIIPNWSLRYSVKPGLTGWAQVTGYRGGTLDPIKMTFRLRRDFKYIERYTPKLDIEIIWRTFKQMILRKTKAH